MRVESISKEQTGRLLWRLFLLYHELRTGRTRYSYVTDAAMFERHVDLCVRLRQEPSAYLRPEITFSGDKQPSAEEIVELHHRSHDVCFIARSVKTKVTVIPA